MMNYIHLEKKATKYIVEGTTNLTVEVWYCKTKREACKLVSGLKKMAMRGGYATRRLEIYASPKPTTDDHPTQLGYWERIMTPGSGFGPWTGGLK